MNRRNLHVGKSMSEKDRYSRYVKRRDYSPTLDEKPIFNPSNQSVEDFSKPTITEKRSVNKTQHILDYFSNNWVGILMAIIIAIITWLMVDAKTDIAVINTSIEYQNEDINELNTDVNSQSIKNNDQDLKINENKFRIDNIEKSEQK